ncbi:universal stress protein [Natrinema caseinilyticum]|uniref:universal stress protein n=1 Tax=Natrinema caseinilyticum TaxID=2961570 RepID=UPI0020C5AA8B|nr:universal stress protein [Natrinema caseinilyticum]
MMYGEILVPVNGTEESETAIPHAFEIAKERGATVHALCAYSRQSRYGALSVESAEHREESLHEQAEQIVDEVAERAAEEGIDCVTTIREGDPTEGILDYVDDNRIGLIVIGARKRSPTGKVLFGSVSQSVILNTTVPVLVTGGR